MTTTNNTLTAVPGIRVGHSTHLEGATGCTVILCPPETTAGVDVRGGAPGTRETDLLHPINLVQHVHAVVLSGGSAYGLATADGVMRWLEERQTGYPVGDFVVPIIPTAILMDLPMGKPGVRPDAAMGYAACEAASDAPVPLGSVGAGTGCRVGPLMGNAYATKGGIGSAVFTLPNGLIVAALCAVNAFGDVIDSSGQIMAGLRADPDGDGFNSTLDMLVALQPPASPLPQGGAGSNTVIGVVATNARLTKTECSKVAQMAQDGVALAVRPAHTMFDGDTLFTLATGQMAADTSLVGAYGALAVAEAIRSAVREATPLAGVRALNP